MIDTHLSNLITEIEKLSEDEKIATLNQIKLALHKISPLNKEPIDCVLWVKNNEVKANNYNPNRVAPPEFKLLKHSIEQDGYTQPVVTFKEDTIYTVIDGYHRTRVGKEDPTIKKRVLGYLPITIVNSHSTNLKNRMAATIRHNRARGVHGIDPMVDIVRELCKQGWDAEKIAKELGMDSDEVLRFLQCVGLPELFKDHEYSLAWE